MALLDSEIERLKAELGFNVLTTGAEPYADITSLFSHIIQPYTSAGASTTSATTVTAADTPTPVTITLASATGFSIGDRIVVDVDARQEIATAQNLSGTSLTLLLSLAHTGTYPVTVEGGESIVRELLTKIRGVKTEMGETFGEGSIKRVDEVEFYQAGSSTFGTLGAQLSFWREELASVLGVESGWSRKRAGAVTLSVY